MSRAVTPANRTTTHTARRSAAAPRVPASCTPRCPAAPQPRAPASAHAKSEHAIPVAILVATSELLHVLRPHIHAAPRPPPPTIHPNPLVCRDPVSARAPLTVASTSSLAFLCMHDPPRVANPHTVSNPYNARSAAARLRQRPRTAIRPISFTCVAHELEPRRSTAAWQSCLRHG